MVSWNYPTQILTAATLWVDPVNGSDVFGLRGRQDSQFKTIAGAIAAPGITAGDSIFLRNGAYTPTGATIVPAGVNVWGQSMPGVQVTCPNAQPNIIQPGSGANANNLCVFGNMTIIALGNGDSPVGFLNGIDGVSTYANYVLCKNICGTGIGDFFYWNPNTATLTGIYWRIENCYANSQWDVLTISQGSGNLAMTVDTFDCALLSANPSVSANPMRCININGGATSAYPCLVRDHHGILQTIGSTNSHQPKTVSATSGYVTIELHGTSISASSTSGTNYLAIAGGNNSTAFIKVSPDCVFNPALVSGAICALNPTPCVTPNRTTVSDKAYTILTTDATVAFVALTAARTATLPTAVGCAGQQYIVVDETGSAATYNITVATTSSQTINGSTTQTISSNYGVLRVYSNGANWIQW